MKLVWCPETAAKAYVDAVRQLAEDGAAEEEKAEAELVAAMAGGWRAQCIVEAWGSSAVKSDATISTSLALSAAASHTGSRHVCVVPDEGRYRETVAARGGERGAAEVVVGGDLAAAAERVEGADFVVADSGLIHVKKGDGGAVIGGLSVTFGARGAVVVCRSSAAGGNAGQGPWWGDLAAAGSRRVVRVAQLPVGGGLEVVHVGGVGKGRSVADPVGRWIRHVNALTGEEHLFRRC